MNRETPTWQPVSALPTLASLFDDIVANTGAQRKTFQSVKAEPDVLDSALIERIETELFVFGALCLASNEVVCWILLRLLLSTRILIRPVYEAKRNGKNQVVASDDK